MLSSSCCMRFLSLLSVKFWSRLLTALNLLPSIAMIASENRSSRRHSTINSRQTLRIAFPLSLRKSAMALKSGAKRPLSHISSTLRWVSQPVEIPVDADLQQHRRMVGGTPGVRRRHPLEAKAGQIQFVDEDVDHTHQVVLDDKVVKTIGQQRNLGSALPFDESLHAAAPNKPDASA